MSYWIKSNDPREINKEWIIINNIMIKNKPITKICFKCGIEKNISDFPPRKDTKLGIRGTCRDCTNKNRREWYKKNQEKQKIYRDKYYANNRKKIIEQKVVNNLKYRRLARLDCIKHYSNGKNECKCCGENHLEFLAIDHIKGNGSIERKKTKEYLPLILKRKGFPEGYRILCHNCNLSLGFYGYCPHQLKMESDF